MPEVRTTVALRFQPALHAQLTLLAKMRGHSLQEEAMEAFEAHLASHEMTMIDKAREMRDQLEAEYQERKRCLDALLTTPPRGEPAG